AGAAGGNTRWALSCEHRGDGSKIGTGLITRITRSLSAFRRPWRAFSTMTRAGRFGSSAPLERRYLGRPTSAPSQYRWSSTRSLGEPRHSSRSDHFAAASVTSKSNASRISSSGALLHMPLPELAERGRKHPEVQKIATPTLNKLLGGVQTIALWASDKGMVPE